MTTNTPHYSVCPLTMPDTTFEEDLELVRSSGASGIGIAEGKLRDGEEQTQLAALKRPASRLRAEFRPTSLRFLCGLRSCIPAPKIRLSAST